jgi:hypothetical protein
MFRPVGAVTASMVAGVGRFDSYVNWRKNLRAIRGERIDLAGIVEYFFIGVQISHAMPYSK